MVESYLTFLILDLIRFFIIFLLTSVSYLNDATFSEIESPKPKFIVLHFKKRSLS